MQQHQRVLHELEEYYPGLAAEYSADGDRGGGGPKDDEPASEERAHRRLRRAATVPALFGYQKELVAALEEVCGLPNGENVALLALPTGGGKTRTAAVALLRILTSGRARSVLWLAPSRELLEQAVETLDSVWHADRGADDVDLVRADLLAEFPRIVDRAVVFATPHMIAARLKRGRVPDADIVIFDEAAR